MTRQEIKYCEACEVFFQDLYVGQRKVLVFGEGPTQPRIMLIGEAPGEQEALKQRPFVGKAGKNLDEFLEICGLNREEIYVTNVVKIRPVKESEKGRLSNRPPNREELELWQPWLNREIEMIKPRAIVTLGNVPLKATTGENVKIGDVHGAWCVALTGQPLFPLYHPAAVIYRRDLRAVYVEDMRRLAETIRED